jgi:transposase
VRPATTATATRLRALIIVLWRGGLRIQEALALGERDLDPSRGSLLVRNGKGGRRREIGPGEDDSVMAQNFIECDREQVFLMPPSLREWLPEDHLAWFVLEAVEEMDLTEFYAEYGSDGHGRAAYEPSMMVALLLYAYATEQRSSRGIEIHCRQDVAYRVIAANRVPDHATIARFLARHEAALAGLFGSVVG